MGKTNGHSPPDTPPAGSLDPQAEAGIQCSPQEAVQIEDFWAHLPSHSYIYRHTRDMWPASSVDAKIGPAFVANKPMKASQWLDINRAVVQMTWAPGYPEVVHDKLLNQGGWIEHENARVYNLYRAPIVTEGDPSLAEMWIEHIHNVYDELEATHIIRWLAHRVQRPGEKINHALVLGGGPGIGKDTLLEPVKYAVGAWNFTDVSPGHLLQRFNGFVKSVVLRVNEARDLGEVDRFGFYDHMKIYTAAPPDVLRCDEKNVREYAVPNVMGVIITTNHKQDGIYLPADDRRHFVAWSVRQQSDFSDRYFRDIYGWYESGGYAHVAAYLRELDLSNFDPKAPPPKTAAFLDIVDANRAPEDAELANVIDALKKPKALTAGRLQAYADDDFREWLRDRRNRRTIPYRLETAGYVTVRNTTAKDGLWTVDGKRQVVYALKELPLRDQLEAANGLLATQREAYQSPEEW